MNQLEHIEADARQVHRRLTELELAVVIGGESGLAWHITQAARGGASAAQVLHAIKLGVEMRGTPTPALAQCVTDIIKRVFSARGGSPATRHFGVEPLIVCRQHRHQSLN